MTTNIEKTEFNQWVYKECRGNELEKLTEIGWELVPQSRTELSAHQHPMFWIGASGCYLLRRPRVKQTEMEMLTEIGELKKKLELNEKLIEKVGQQYQQLIEAENEDCEMLNKFFNEQKIRVRPFRKVNNIINMLRQSQLLPKK